MSGDYLVGTTGPFEGKWSAPDATKIEVGVDCFDEDHGFVVVLNVQSADCIDSGGLGQLTPAQAVEIGHHLVRAASVCAENRRRCDRDATSGRENA